VEEFLGVTPILISNLFQVRECLFIADSALFIPENYSYCTLVIDNISQHIQGQGRVPLRFYEHTKSKVFPQKLQLKHV
jgi:hypothetical protein